MKLNLIKESESESTVTVKTSHVLLTKYFISNETEKC